MLILGIDPGRTSGLVVLHAKGDDYLVVEYAQVDIEKMPEYLEYRLGQVELVAVETYTITPKTHTLSRQPAAFYVIGGAMFLAALAGVQFRLQTPADAKTAFSDPVLRDMGLWGKVIGDHARDALRHALLAARIHAQYDDDPADIEGCKDR